jgi:hypothetical protein
VNAQQLALLYRFLLGLVLVEIPVGINLLSSPAPDYRLLLIGLLGGLATALEKYLAPYVFGGLNAAPADVAHAPSPAAATAAALTPPIVITTKPEQLIVPPENPV